MILETMLSIELRKKYIFAQIEEYLDNTYKYSIQRAIISPGYFDNEKIDVFDTKEKKNEETEINDEEIEWVIKQFYEGEKEV